MEEYSRRPYSDRNYDRRHIDVDWPWEYRYNRGWRTRYEFRQVVYLEDAWNWRGRDTRLDIRTRYHHQVRRASRYRAEVDIYIDEILLYENGRFLGEVRHVPAEIGRLRAVIHRNGRMELDRSVFVVGDPHAGFELINTRYYGGYALSSYGYALGLRAGVLDFRRERVLPIRRTRLYDAYNYDRFVPISLLPEDGEWLYDYGYGSASAHLHGRPGGYHYYGGQYDRDDYYDLGADEDYRANSARSTGEPNLPGRDEALQRSQEESVKLDNGSSIRVRRQTELKRIE